MDVNKITLGYWSTKGLGSASRQMIIYAGVPLIAKIYKVLPKEENNQIIYEGSSWHDNDKIDLKKKNSLINLPYLKYLKDDKEFIISHSNTCLTFLGKEFGMFGETQEEELECEQLLQETVDLRSIVTRFAYTHFNSTILFPANYKAEYTEAFEAKAIAAKRFPQNALQIERRLNSILNFDARTFTHKVTSPCLVITSKDDILMPPWHADNLTKEIKNTTKYCLNFGGHMLPETRSKKISLLTRNFLLEHSQG